MSKIARKNLFAGVASNMKTKIRSILLGCGMMYILNLY